MSRVQHRAVSCEWCLLRVFSSLQPLMELLSLLSPQIVSSKKITRPLLLMNDKPAGKGLITVPAPPPHFFSLCPLPSPINGPLPWQIDNHQLCLE